MPFEATIGEIPARLLAKQPTPAELGDLIARWPDEKVAEFLAALGEAIKRHGPVGDKRGERIGAALAREEIKFLDGSGSQLIEGVSLGYARVPS
jgi:hypothetical protein